jgi:thiamine kinase-like enzyme
LRAFDPVAFAAEYLESLGGERALPVVQRPFADALTMLARDYRARYPHMVLCHNDLVASNILDDGGLWLIDFEYAVTAAPVLDIAGIAAMNDYGRYERLQLSEAYYEGSPVPFSAAELDKVVRLVRLIAYFWALSSAEQTAEPEPYRRFAEHIEAQLT